MKKIVLYVLVVSIAMTSCQKFIDVNTNPNTPTVTKANYVFANALNSSARISVGGMHITPGHWTGYYGHSTSFTGGGEEKTYVFTNNSFNFFDGAFDNLNDYQYVIDRATADGFGYMVGPAMIMQAYIYQKVVDMYGNVPFSEALQGTKFYTPKYDDAATIYQALVNKLTTAVNLINAATFPANDPSDVYFNANKTRWKQFANSIKLRLIIRRSNVPGYVPTNDINSISADGFIDYPVTSNPGYTKTVGKLNQYYQNWGFNENDAPTGDFRKMGLPIIQWFKASLDLWRLQRYASVKGDPNNDSALTLPVTSNFNAYAGVPLGGVNGQPAGASYLSSDVSAMGRMQIRKSDALRALILMTDAEVYLLIAEARFRGWLPGSAQSAYEEGVRRAFRIASNAFLITSGTSTAIAPYSTATQAQSDAAANTYLINTISQADWSVSPDKLKAIWTQKWVALCNVDGSEAWAEYRRTTSPTNTNGILPAPASSFNAHSVAVGGPEPVRLFYPLRESNVNTANVPANIDIFTSRIFWDIN